ncbi:hypothetical protein CI104_19680 [Citrobacter farmeri]|uniref:Uncharacterized protein n=1 Tax=Citrobacter farmeri TaxID=67824 RepID=A0ACA8D9V7_9ENTR|nr:hypothetical protein CI104_19680 [Citrobacter farmeri]
MAHILLSGTYKSNNFSCAFIVCTLHVQLVCKNGKKSVLSTDKSVCGGSGYTMKKIDGYRRGMRNRKRDTEE